MEHAEERHMFTERAHLAGLEPTRDAMEMECMVALAPAQREMDNSRLMKLLIAMTRHLTASSGREVRQTILYVHSAKFLVPT
jgi:hypothetical protein